MRRSILTVISFVLCIIMSLSACGNGKSTVEKANPASDFEYHTDGDYVVIDKYIGSDDTVVIPGKIEKIAVKTIGQDAFKNANITSVSIPDSVETIWIEAFAECQNLRDVKFGTGLIEIGDSAFYHCNSIEVLKLPQGLKSLGNCAVSECSSLKEVFLPSTLTLWGNSFFNNKSLTSIHLEDGISSIDPHAFQRSSALETVTIPASVKTINIGAFAVCGSLKSVYFEGDAPNISDNAFLGNNSNLIFYYNKSSAGWDDILSSGDYVLETY